MTVIQTSKNKALQAQVCLRTTWVTPCCKECEPQLNHFIHCCCSQAKSLVTEPGLSSFSPSSPLILHLDSFHDQKSLLDSCLNCTAVSLEAQTWKIITQCCWSCLSISKVTGWRQRRSPGQRAEPCYFRCFGEKRNCSQPACRFHSWKTR